LTRANFASTTHSYLGRSRKCRELVAESDESVRTEKVGTKMTEDEWVAKLRKMKEETEKEIAKVAMKNSTYERNTLMSQQK
jgi:hypothetical protein